MELEISINLNTKICILIIIITMLVYIFTIAKFGDSPTKRLFPLSGYGYGTSMPMPVLHP